MAANDDNGNGMIIEQDEAGDWRSSGDLVGLDTALMDQQIATARRYPRAPLQRISEEISAMVTYSDEVAEECIYAVPRGGKSITGPSVRFAEAVASCWGNSESGARVIETEHDFVVAQASYRDLQRNIRVVIEVKRPIIDSNGNRYKLDMIGVTSNAAMSIALRNAILKGIPKAAWGPAFSKVTAMVAGSFESLEKRRTAAFNAFKKLGVGEDLVLQIVNARSVKDVGPEDMLVLRGTLQAIKDGDTTVTAVFGNSTTRNAGQKANLGEQLEKGKANGKAKGSEAKPGAETGNGGTAERARASEEDRGSGASTDGGGKDGTNADEGDAGTVAGGDHDRGEQSNGDASGASDGGSVANASDRPEAEPIDEERWRPFIDQAGDEKSAAKLINFARALEQANTAVQVTSVVSEFRPVFEAAGGDLEQVATKMAANASSAIRAAKKSGSAATKL